MKYVMKDFISWQKDFALITIKVPIESEARLEGEFEVKGQLKKWLPHLKMSKYGSLVT